METKIDWGFVVTMIVLVVVCGPILYAAFGPKKLELRKAPTLAFWRLWLPVRRRLRK